MLVQSYLSFNGRCEEAIDFYKKALGAELIMLMRWNESPEPPPAGMLASGFEKKVMHSSFRIGETELMASDGDGKSPPKFTGISLTIGGVDAKEAERRFNALADGGKVTMPLGKTFWSSAFGAVVDRFGVEWMVSADPEEGQA
jgi:PhnB protein